MHHKTHAKRLRSIQTHNLETDSYGKAVADLQQTCARPTSKSANHKGPSLQAVKCELSYPVKYISKQGFKDGAKVKDYAYHRDSSTTSAVHLPTCQPSPDARQITFSSQRRHMNNIFTCSTCLNTTHTMEVAFCVTNYISSRLWYVLSLTTLLVSGMYRCLTVCVV